MKELFNLISLHKITPNQFYMLYCIETGMVSGLMNQEGELRLLRYSNFITQENVLTQKAKDVLLHAEAMFVKAKKKVVKMTLGTEAPEMIEKFRQLFPTGQPAVHGKTIRNSPKELLDKMIWFFTEYPDYTDWDLIFQATTNFVADSFKQQHKYLCQSKYFISKRDTYSGVYSSELATYCQEILDGVITQVTVPKPSSTLFKVS